MTEETTLKVGDPCPNCGGELTVDATQDVDRLVDRRKRNAASPAVAARYEERAREKAERFGTIHKCGRCSYTARLKADDDDAAAAGESKGNAKGARARAARAE